MVVCGDSASITGPPFDRITVRSDANTPDHMPKKLQHDMRYVKGQEVMVFNLDGSIVGTAVIASFNMKNGNYRVWFQYEHANEQELIELPASMLAELMMQRI